MENVQKYVFHHNNEFNTEVLMNAYLKGYRLVINLNVFKRDNFDVVPDNIFLKKGVLCESNAQLVSKAKRIIEDLGGELANSNEARQLLGLT